MMRRFSLMILAIVAVSVISAAPRFSTSQNSFSLEIGSRAEAGPRGVGQMTYGFIAPNEYYPAASVAALKDIQEGLLISVGTERALMTAILNPKIKSILQLDFDERVVRYNRINLELLKIAKSREDYWHLRFEANIEEWIERATAAGDSAGFAESYDWWREALTDIPFRGFHTDWTKQWVSNPPFEGAHYLFDDKAFEHIHKMALEKRIRVRQGDLSDYNQMIEVLESIHEPIAVFDISNAWQESYAGPKAIYDLSRLMRRFDPKARFLATNILNESIWEYTSFAPGEFKVGKDVKAPIGIANHIAEALKASCDFLLGGKK